MCITRLIKPYLIKDSVSNAIHFHDVTGGVYKAQVHIHRSMLIYDY